LNHDELTDIITFELSEKGRPIIAEIYISIDRVKENAINHSDSFYH
jgi:ssRNA-specific RNase YbeY (16S rRNA maturation enzyme)